MSPLEGLLVLDFSTLLPGPMTSLILAEAGATVIKIERPGRGDEMRSYVPRVGDDSINFHLLNRGKKSIAIDLKAAGAVDRLKSLIEKADVLIEQFRPGVMDKLGLGYEAVRALNPKLIYCSITGWGQTGPKSQVAAHDLNYMAETGILGLSAGNDGAPVIPPVLIADLAGGTYPAVMNIMFALRQRDQSGLGTYLDVAMGDSLFNFAYWGLGNGVAVNAWPQSGKDLVTGGSPRYQIYRTSDGRHVAAAPLEDKFWGNFCRIIELPDALRDSDASGEVIAAVAGRIAAKTADQWRHLFDGQDVCCSIVVDLKTGVDDPHTVARQLFARRLIADGKSLPALPVPVMPQFLSGRMDDSAPSLGENNSLLES
jgi:alpha-methylacyl-CoA racemase